VRLLVRVDALVHQEGLCGGGGGGCLQHGGLAGQGRGVRVLLNRTVHEDVDRE
jgi:hypothetical protein